jgi:LacI family transcriptional regulator
VAETWDAEQRRAVINISRSRDLAGIASVTCDDALIGRMAAEHLLDKNLQAFAYFGAESRRESAFAECIAAHDRPYHCLNADAVSKPQLHGWLKGLPLRTGVMAFNDQEAAHLLWAAQAVGRTVPEDLAVVGVDADHIQSLLAPIPITSVDPDFFRVGYLAAELLDRILHDGYDARAERIRVPPRRVVEQASSDFAGIGDTFAVQAARFIRRHACEDLRVTDVVDAVPLSRRPLERRFRRIFGRTLLEEIQRLRIAEAARLLTHTRLPVSEVAQESGFKSHARFTQLFGQTVGVSPAEYRRNHQPKRD